MPVKLCDYHINGCAVFTSFVFVFCYCNVLPRTPCHSSGPDPGSSFVKIIRCWFMVPFCLKFPCLRRQANSDFFHLATQCVNGNLLPFLQHDLNSGKDPSRNSRKQEPYLIVGHTNRDRYILSGRDGLSSFRTAISRLLFDFSTGDVVFN